MVEHKREHKLELKSALGNMLKEGPTTFCILRSRKMNHEEKRTNETIIVTGHEYNCLFVNKTLPRPTGIHYSVAKI